MSLASEIDDDPFADLPGVLAQVAEACGYGAALTFATSFGGTELYVPTPERLGEDHPMAVALGLATARAAAKAIGHGKIIVPLGPASQTRQKWARFGQMVEARCSNTKIARALGVHLRTIERYKAKRRGPADRDPDFFD